MSPNANIRVIYVTYWTLTSWVLTALWFFGDRSVMRCGKTYLRDFSITDDMYHPVHLVSIIEAIDISLIERPAVTEISSGQRTLWSDCAHMQAYLIIRWHVIRRFLATRLIKKWCGFMGLNGYSSPLGMGVTRVLLLDLSEIKPPFFKDRKPKACPVAKLVRTTQALANLSRAALWSVGCAAERTRGGSWEHIRVGNVLICRWRTESIKYSPACVYCGNGIKSRFKESAGRPSARNNVQDLCSAWKPKHFFFLSPSNFSLSLW